MKYDELLANLCGWPRVCASYEGSIDELLDKASDAIEELQKENLRLHAFNDMNLEAREMLHERIKELQQIAGHYEESAHDYFKDACYYLERMPKWIPVSERLPEKTGKYLVCGQWMGKPVETWVCELIAFGNIKGWANEARNPIVTHWMPLPEPPKDGGT